MARPTLIIGIGTSGLRVLEETQKFYFEHTGRNKPGNVHYMYLETDEAAYPSATVAENDIVRIFLDISDKETKINNLRENIPEGENEWIPDPDYIKDAGVGAGGMPAFGRTALWSQPNFDGVKTAIREAFNKINSHTEKESDNTEPAVFITGSLTGGTGSGVFIDIAYMIKYQIQGMEDVYGLFLTPGRNYVGKDNILYCNTLSSLISLEKYNQPKQEYAHRWPDGTAPKINALPFEMAHFISQDRDDGIAQISSISGLYKIAGLWMFLNIFGLREKRARRLVDSRGSSFIDKYGTFGISAVQYPKRQLEELLGIDLSISLLNRWIDSSACYIRGNKVEIRSVRQKIVSETKDFFEEALRSAFKTLDATLVDGENGAIAYLEEIAEQINKKQFNEPSERDFIIRWFSSNRDNNYYTALQNNLQTAEDELIQKIFEYISSKLDVTENLYISKIQLEAIAEAINSTIKYWQSLELSTKSESWENSLEKQIDWTLKKRYKLIFQQDNVVFDRLKTTFELMKIHLMGKRILSIKNNIINQEDALRTFQDGIALPKVALIEKLIEKISHVIRTPDRNQADMNKTLQSRYDDIIAELRDNTIPILRIYPDGSTEEARKRCFEVAKSEYLRQVGTKIPSKSTLIGGDSLWKYINESQDKFHLILFKDCISRFEGDVIAKKCFKDMNIAEYMKKELKQCGKMAEIAKSPLFMVNNDNRTTFAIGKGIPRLMIGKDEGQIKEVFRALKSNKENSHAVASYKEDEDGIWVNEHINNIVIFYVEQGYMSNGDTFNPIKHFKSIYDIQRIYNEETRRYTRTRGVEEKVWHNLRCPYLNFEEMKKHSSDNQNASR